MSVFRHRGHLPILSGERDRFRSCLQLELTEQHDAGKIEEEDFIHAMSASDRDHVIDRVIREAEKPTPDSQFSYSMNWDDIVTWIKDHWWDILKFILTIALLFLDEEGGAHGHE